MKNIPILILHGWNLSAVNFLPLKKELNKRGYEVYCPDLPGFGKTRLTKTSWFLSDYVNFVKSYLRKNKLSKVILIGHSFGGRVGIKFAAENSKLLAALILTGVPGISPASTLKAQFFLALAKLGKLIFALPLLSSVKDLSRKFLYKAASASDYYNTNDHMLETFRNTVKEPLVPYMAQIDLPTLLLWGKEDKIIPVFIASKMKNIIKKSKLVIVDEARHAVPYTHPKEFADEVEKFLN